MNKKTFFTTIGAAMILLTGLLGLQPGLQAAEKVTLSFDHWYDNAAIAKALMDLQAAYPQLLAVTSIGKSVQGRDIWAAVINNPKTGPADRKPGYYIDGNIHGNEIQGGEVALYTVNYLLKNYGKTEFATRLVDRLVFYVIPTMNPDSRDFYIHQAADPNSPRTGWFPIDDDRDGLKDEDPPEDLDGDGSITMMRKRDPLGRWRTSPDDPRLMVPVKPGEKGEWTMLGEEGIDNDGDGLLNEDGPGSYDMNRNFGYNWQPEYVQGGAGPYPFRWPETKAVRDFILAHPNILGAQSYHNFGGMILRGPGAKNLGDYNPADIRVFDEIAKRGEKIIPGYTYTVVYRDMYTVYGGTIDFMYANLGIFCFSNELDTDLVAEMSPKKEGEDEGVMAMLGREENLDEMIFRDNVEMGEHYTAWKSYKHPLYGDIEIGGAGKFSARVPPLFKLAETCHRNAAFSLYHADQMPVAAFEAISVKKLEGGVFQVDVHVTNAKITPTISAQAVSQKLHRPDRIVVGGKNAALLAVGEIQDRFLDRTFPVKSIKNTFDVDGGVPGRGRREFRLLVKGSGAVTLTFESLKGGTAEKTIELK
ncbi:MAG: peptidase M14 [Candidatus Aminicenantes bacterium]|nr:peptidase M14 [Candidatus Aminicenantes bacterium]